MIPMHSVYIGEGRERHSMTRADLTAALHYYADRLHANGWAVIGSRFKQSCLHPWKGIDPKQLLAWAHENFDSGLANSINLRLDGTDVIALDADFPDPALADRLLAMLTLQGIVSRGQRYTVAGSKGFKLFLRMKGARPARLPAVIGPVAWPDGHNGEKAFKHDVELKRDLSTVFGAYPSEDWLYSEYPDTEWIALAAVSDLPVAEWSDLGRIAAIIAGVMEAAGFRGEGGRALTRQSTHDMVMSVLCYAVRRMLSGRSVLALADFLIFAGCYSLAAAVSDLVRSADCPMWPFCEPEFQILEENSPLRSDVKRAWELLRKPEPELTGTMADMVETFFAPQKSWLSARLMRAGVSPANLDLLETYDLWRRVEYLAGVKTAEAGRAAA